MLAEEPTDKKPARKTRRKAAKRPGGAGAKTRAKR
jgi:hypothetical protein